MTNTKAQHTPGPWKFFSWATICGATSDKYDDVAHCSSLRNDRPFSEVEANARLIAAAPELLEAALCAVAALSQNKTFPADIVLAKKALSAAIAKATGN